MDFAIKNLVDANTLGDKANVSFVLNENGQLVLTKQVDFGIAGGKNGSYSLLEGAVIELLGNEHMQVKSGDLQLRGGAQVKLSEGENQATLKEWREDAGVASGGGTAGIG